MAKFLTSQNKIKTDEILVLLPLEILLHINVINIVEKCTCLSKMCRFFTPKSNQDFDFEAHFKLIHVSMIKST